MNGTSIDKLRMMQQMPQQREYSDVVMTGDNTFENNDYIDTSTKNSDDIIDDLDIQQPRQHNEPSKHKQIQHGQKMIQMDQMVEQTIPKEPKMSFIKNIPEFMREPLLIVIIYLILSLDIVKKTLANYIPQIKPTDGNVAILGIIVYALILAGLFMTAKKVLL